MNKSGIACPTCGSMATSVSDSRPKSDPSPHIRRRRVCVSGHAFYTIETCDGGLDRDMIDVTGLPASTRRKIEALIRSLPKKEKPRVTTPERALVALRGGPKTRNQLADILNRDATMVGGIMLKLVKAGKAQRIDMQAIGGTKRGGRQEALYARIDYKGPVAVGPGGAG